MASLAPELLLHTLIKAILLRKEVSGTFFRSHIARRKKPPGVNPGCRTYDLQMPRLGTYFEICKQLKRTMDPNGIMGPDTMPIMDDYL
jgi:hypothetical protein